MVLWCFFHVCFVQVTILKLVWHSRHTGAHRCAYFPTDISSVIQEGEITVESARTEARHRVGSTIRCHFDETNMDITTVHHCNVPDGTLYRSVTIRYCAPTVWCCTYCTIMYLPYRTELKGKSVFTLSYNCTFQDMCVHCRRHVGKNATF